MADDIFPDRKWLRHELPFRVSGRNPVFFITVCCRDRGRNQLTTGEMWAFLFESIEKRNIDGVWNCRVFVAMPDHVHGIFSFDGTDQMKVVIPQWKRWVALQTGVVWQKGFFDHRLRSDASAHEKHEYILQNPVRAGLVDHPSDWPYTFNPLQTEDEP